MQYNRRCDCYRQENVKISYFSYPTPLSLYPFSNNKRTIETIFSSINAGHALANDTIVNASVEELPFGGVGLSGLGRCSLI
jgi:acyl-CoA reductase-like NAD-dependent aldehyde dehydrogenase